MCAEVRQRDLLQPNASDGRQSRYTSLIRWQCPLIQVKPHAKYHSGNKANSSCRLPVSHVIHSYQLPDNHAITQFTLCSVTSILCAMPIMNSKTLAGMIISGMHLRRRASCFDLSERQHAEPASQAALFPPSS